MDKDIELYAYGLTNFNLLTDYVNTCLQLDIVDKAEFVGKQFHTIPFYRLYVNDMKINIMENPSSFDFAINSLQVDFKNNTIIIPKDVDIFDVFRELITKQIPYHNF